MYGNLSYALVSRKLELKVGPQFQYGLTNLYNHEMYGSRHLLFAGIITRIAFPGK